jgi:putative salt-induced outer membrane protein YdiY
MQILALLLFALLPTSEKSLESAVSPDTSPQTPAPEVVLHRWTGAVSVGAVSTNGNTDTNSVSATADGEYRREKDRTTLGAFWSYQDQKNSTGGTDVTDRKTGGKGKYDYFFSKKVYGLAQASADNDYQADLKLRTTIGVGAGYQWREDAKIKFGTEAGLSEFSEDFYNSPDDDYLAARLAEKLDWNINKDWSIGHTAEAFPSLENADDLYTKIDTRLKVSLTKKMFAQLQWVWDWDNTPAAGKDRSDNRYALTLGWSF